MKAKLDVSERRVGELEEERHRQHPEDERLRALGREMPLQETVGGCTLLPHLCSVLNAVLAFFFFISQVAERGLSHSHEMRLWCGVLFTIVPKAAADLLYDQRTVYRGRVISIEIGRSTALVCVGT